ncbi:MAG: hypothetical protein AAGF36_01525 [Pseudomonadota bacterium]
MSNDKQGFSPSSATYAVVTTIIGAPIIYDATDQLVVPLLERSYGYGREELYQFVWAVATGALVLFPSYAFFKLMIALLSAGLIYRLI